MGKFTFIRAFTAAAILLSSQIALADMTSDLLKLAQGKTDGDASRIAEIERFLQSGRESMKKNPDNEYALKYHKEAVLRVGSLSDAATKKAYQTSIGKEAGEFLLKILDGKIKDGQRGYDLGVIVSYIRDYTEKSNPDILAKAESIQENADKIEAQATKEREQEEKKASDAAAAALASGKFKELSGDPMINIGDETDRFESVGELAANLGPAKAHKTYKLLDDAVIITAINQRLSAMLQSKDGDKMSERILKTWNEAKARVKISLEGVNAPEMRKMAENVWGFAENVASKRLSSTDIPEAQNYIADFEKTPSAKTPLGKAIIANGKRLIEKNKNFDFYDKKWDRVHSDPEYASLGKELVELNTRWTTINTKLHLRISQEDWRSSPIAEQRKIGPRIEAIVKRRNAIEKKYNANN